MGGGLDGKGDASEYNHANKERMQLALDHTFTNVTRQRGLSQVSQGITSNVSATLE